jgi:hypothetical protein
MSNFIKRPPVITICGSTTYWEDQITAQAILGVKGIVGIPCAFTMKQPERFPGLTDYLDDHPATKADLDVLHFGKIELSDAIWVIATDGYVGDSTIREIQLADRLGKRIFCTQKLAHDAFNNLDIEIVELAYDTEFPNDLEGSLLISESAQTSPSLWLKRQVELHSYIAAFTNFIKYAKGCLGA